MSEGLLEAHADELRARLAALTAGLGVVAVDELKGQAHRLRGSALVLGLDDLAGAVAAYEAALAAPPDLDTARRAADRAAYELSLALPDDLLRSLRHDLRNDLNIVLMGSKLLEADLQSDNQRELAAGIAAAAERMASRLVDPQQPESVRAPGSGPVEGSGALSVLLVEDDPLVASVVARMLGAAGASVEAVGGLAEARAALTERGYDVAVVDLRLADGSGEALVPDLRERGIRAIVLTGDGRTVVPGAEQVLAKPVESAVLVAAVTGRPLTA